MITFEYKGYNAAGQAQQGLLEAQDPKHAREQLAQAGILTSWLAPAGSRRRHALFGQSRFDGQQRSELYRELASLLHSGLPLMASLDLLIQAPELAALRPRLANIRDKIREGASLAEALAAAGAISPYEKAVIAAGERAAELDLTLDRLADFMEEQQRLREKILTALIYPAILLALALIIAVGLLGFAMPRLGQMLAEQSRLPMPLLTRLMIQAGHLVAWLAMPLIALAALTLGLLRRRLRRDPASARQANRRCFQLPIIGPAYSILVNLRFARTLSLLLRSGLPLIDSLSMAGAATGSPWLSDLAEQATEALRHGSSLAEVLRRIPPLAQSLAGWVQVGEAGGSLDIMLDNAARRFQQQWERYLTRRVAILEPALIILIGGFVLLVVLAILLPIVSLNKTLL